MYFNGNHSETCMPWLISHKSIVPIRVPCKCSLVHPHPTFVKVSRCSSPIACDQLGSMKRHDREAIPPVLFDWNHIKAKVEHDLGSMTGMEYHDLSEWKLLTDLHALDLYQRYEKFQFMLVVPIRLPSQYGSTNPGPGYVKVCCCSSPH
jgi:hypothetical protein